MLTSAVHEFGGLGYGTKSLWRTMDKLYNSLEELQALQINLPLVPEDPKSDNHVEEKGEVEEIVQPRSLLQHTRLETAPFAFGDLDYLGYWRGLFNFEETREVGGSTHPLPLLQAREDFTLAFTIKEEPIPWETAKEELKKAPHMPSPMPSLQSVSGSSTTTTPSTGTSSLWASD